MTLIIKIIKGIEYLYFQAGDDTIYIGPNDDSTRSKMNNVMKALEYSRERTDRYIRSLDELLQFLPARTRERYLSRQIARLQRGIKHYESLLPNA